jgi:predicted anti-sigma-YlaC factor YlaD
MSAARCPREDELLDALGRGFVGSELETHVAACSACGELRVVAGALLDDRAQAMSEAQVPSSGTMWWRMRVRHRQEIATQARRSLLIGQAATLVIALGLLFAFFGSDLAIEARHLVTTIRFSTPFLLAAATCALLIPIAGWVAIRQK